MPLLSFGSVMMVLVSGHPQLDTEKDGSAFVLPHLTEEQALVACHFILLDFFFTLLYSTRCGS